MRVSHILTQIVEPTFIKNILIRIIRTCLYAKIRQTCSVIIENTGIGNTFLFGINQILSIIPSRSKFHPFGSVQHIYFLFQCLETDTCIE